MADERETNTRYRIAVTADITPPYFRKLSELGDVETCGWVKTGVLMSEEEQIERMKGRQIYLVGYERVSERVVARLPELRLVACARANPVNVESGALSRRGIPLVFTPGRNAVAAAEFTIGMMLSEARHIARAHHALKTGRYLGAPSADVLETPERDDVVWNLSGDSPYKLFHGFELSDKTLSLLGFGHIGRMVAHYALAFDMRILSYDPYVDPGEAAALGVTLVDLPTLYREADFLSVHCKVSPETEAMVDARAFALMKTTAIIVNAGRASIVDQAALLDALRNKRIAGAALDVFWEEPLPSNHPLLALDNVTITPHLAGASYDVPGRQSRMIVEDIERWIRGERPRNVWNRDAL
jgi:D-3-phosphoglycerate dehydrogenase